MAPVVEHWVGQDTTIAEIERQLGSMRAAMLADERRQPNQRTSVMTHVAWVPPEWLAAAEEVLEGLEDRHPSRTVVLIPMTDDGPGLEVELSVRCFTAGDRAVASEVIRLRLRGGRATSPASLVLPLALSDLPLFVRWRGEPPFGEASWDELLGVADRVVVDSSEWGSLRYGELARAFDRAAVSDIEWARTADWRLALADCWPGIREQEIRIRGPRGQAMLLRGWLTSRLQRAIRPVELADEVGVRLGGEELRPPLDPQLSPSDLLSAELDRFGRDLVYEQAVLAAGS
jgi:glucose-6-phosphate dehydrogenase assembly protein OpcA